jgi:hypothetical protein
MKLAFFDDFKLGVVAGDKVVDVTDVVKDIPRGLGLKTSCAV